MKLFFRSLVVLIFVALAALVSAETTYVLRYPDATQLRGFLRTNSFVLVKRIPRQPVYLVRDRLNRPVVDVLALDDDDNFAIEVNQDIWISGSNLRESIVRNQLVFRAHIADRSLTSFFGSTVPARFELQAAAQMIRAREARRAFGAGSGIVAVIDTGVDPNHPFLVPVLRPGFDFTKDIAGANEFRDLTQAQYAVVNPTTTPLLEHFEVQVNPTTTPLLEEESVNRLATTPLPQAFGHGTMVAGAIRLVAPNARILPLKAFGADGRGKLFDVLRAIYFAQVQGSRIINMSLNTLSPSQELEIAIEFVSSRRVICVASVGNNGLLTDTSYPAAYPWVTGVASVDPWSVRSPFSNHGTNLVRVAAPGEGLLLPYPGNRWAGGWGTSFAAPLVSGAASIMVRGNHSANFSTLHSALSHSRISPDPTLGFGVLDVFDLVASTR